MRARLMALAAATLLFILPLQSCWASLLPLAMGTDLKSIELPAALADDDSFDDLPFEQLRQALREEVERDPQKNTQPHSSKRYNLLIR